MLSLLAYLFILGRFGLPSNIDPLSPFDKLSAKYFKLALDLQPEQLRTLQGLEMMKEKEAFIDSHPRGPISRISKIGNETITEILMSLNLNQHRALAHCSTMFRQEALRSFVEIRGKQEDFTIMFLNSRKDRVDLMWDGPMQAVRQGSLSRQGESTVVNTYKSHKFYAMDQQGNIIIRWEAMENKFLYEVPSDHELTELEKEEKEFKRDYYQKTGRIWENIYPRDAPIWPFVQATEMGEILYFESNVSMFDHCPTPLESGFVDPFTGLGSEPCEIPQCPIFKVKVECMDPPVFVLQNDIMTEYERRKIIELARPDMVQSVVGVDGDTDLKGRSSSTAWLNRNHKVVDDVIRRIADIVGIPEDVLYLNKSSESLQVVHYLPGQHYNNHVDYGTEEYKNRFITFLLYLNDVEKGGDTGFIKASGECPKNLHPGAGKGLWFYDLLPDGNVDAHTMHTGRYVEAGEKWLCNLWIWDPHF